MHDAADVDVDDGVPLVQGEQFGVAAPSDSGVVEHQVEPSGAGDDGVDGGRHRGRVGDVEGGRCRGAGTVQALRGAGRRGAVDVGADDVGARVDQGPAQRRADARAGAGDDRLLAGEIPGSHCAASFITWP